MQFQLEITEVLKSRCRCESSLGKLSGCWSFSIWKKEKKKKKKQMWGNSNKWCVLKNCRCQQNNQLVCDSSFVNSSVCFLVFKLLLSFIIYCFTHQYCFGRSWILDATLMSKAINKRQHWWVWNIAKLMSLHYCDKIPHYHTILCTKLSLRCRTHWYRQGSIEDVLRNIVQ